jgi:hypothetical protein
MHHDWRQWMNGSPLASFLLPLVPMAPMARTDSILFDSFTEILFYVLLVLFSLTTSNQGIGGRTGEPNIKSFLGMIKYQFDPRLTPLNLIL